MKSNDYFENRKINCLERTDAILDELPPFCTEFFIGIENNTSALTRLNYAVDLRIFFNFVCSRILTEKDVRSVIISDLEKISATDLERFLSYLNNYKRDGKTYSCNERAKQRKLASVRAMYKYFFNKDKIAANTAAKVKSPKIHDKEIIRLDIKEVSEIISEAGTGDGLSKRQKAYHRNIQKRDIAIITLFLGTGIRISELVGLNVDDIFPDSNSFVVTRKGGNRTILYFNEEVKKSLMDWISYRNEIKELPKSETALFISLRNRRISVRSVQVLVEKYAKIVTPLKKITPHKLRSTFGTNLYRETGDIYVVADLLGHRDINTTKKHYAAMSDSIRKEAIKKVKLHEET